VKQDRVTELEKQLDDVDKEEKSGIFLGSIQKDKNDQRKQILSQLDTALAEYDEFLQRSDWIMNMPYPRPEALRTMQTWRDSTKSIYRPETRYMDLHRWELLSIGDRNHLTYNRLEQWLVAVLETVLSLLHKLSVSFCFVLNHHIDMLTKADCDKSEQIPRASQTDLQTSHART